MKMELHLSLDTENDNDKELLLALAELLELYTDEKNLSEEDELPK